MNCESCQNQICDALDQGEAAKLDALAAKHLAACPVCREFFQVIAAVDEQLIGQARRAVLPSDFQKTLMARLPARQTKISPEELAARRLQCEREYREALRALDRRFLMPPADLILRLLTVAGVCALACLLFAGALTAIAHLIEAAIGGAMTVPALVQAGWVVGAGAFLCGFLVARSRLRVSPLGWTPPARFEPFK